MRQAVMVFTSYAKLVELCVERVIYDQQDMLGCRGWGCFQVQCDRRFRQKISIPHRHSVGSWPEGVLRQ